jgi:hypothetical protein
MEANDIAEMFQKVLQGQNQVRRSLESKIDKMRNEFMSQLDTQIKAIRSDFALEMAKMQKDIDQLGTRLGILEMNRVEENVHEEKPAHQQPSASYTEISDLSVRNTEITVVITGLRETMRLSLDEQIEEILECISLQDKVNVVHAQRLKSKVANRPGLVKVAFENREQKIEVLRAKSKLLDSEYFKKVFIRSSKTHTERIVELNARTLLKQMPNGHRFRIAGNGRIIERKTEDGVRRGHDDTMDRRGQTYTRSYGRNKRIHNEFVTNVHDEVNSQLDVDELEHNNNND